MKPDVPVVICDACIFFDGRARDLLIRLAIAHRLALRWTVDIRNEWVSSLCKSRPDLSKDRLLRTAALMEEHVPEWEVCNYTALIPSLSLPDRNDRHVLAAAIAANARLITTMNFRDFPEVVLSRFGIKPIHPDDLIVKVTLDAPDVLEEIVEDIVRSLRNPPIHRSTYVEKLREGGLMKTAALLDSGQ